MKNNIIYDKTFYIKTFGCKVNVCDEEKMANELLKHEFIYKNNEKDANIIIVNTCTVTHLADKKSKQYIRRIKRQGKIVVATGCMINKNYDDIKEYIDIIVENKRDIYNILKNNLNFNCNLNKIKNNNVELLNKNLSDLNNINLFPHNYVRRFIKVQDGCQQFCSYCIIPYVRGILKSEKDEDIISKILFYEKMGVKEVVLSGIHLSSFGLDRFNLKYEDKNAIEKSRKCILNLLYKISNINGIKRIRLSSLEPRLINETFLNGLLDEKMNNKFCFSFCLSLQSGSNKILKKMNRHYTKEIYEESVNMIRDIYSDSIITTDIIVGFPEETDDDFCETVDFVKKMKLYNINIFPYSKREGTVAYNNINQVDDRIKSERVSILSNEMIKNNKNILDEYFKKPREVLIDEKDGIFSIGYTKEYIKVKTTLNKNIGDFFIYDKKNIC